MPEPASCFPVACLPALSRSSTALFLPRVGCHRRTSCVSARLKREATLFAGVGFFHVDFFFFDTAEDSTQTSRTQGTGDLHERPSRVVSSTPQQP